MIGQTLGGGRVIGIAEHNHVAVVMVANIGPQHQFAVASYPYDGSGTVHGDLPRDTEYRETHAQAVALFESRLFKVFGLK